jgi:hypothetical protein
MEVAEGRYFEVNKGKIFKMIMAAKVSPGKVADNTLLGKAMGHFEG